MQKSPSSPRRQFTFTPSRKLRTPGTSIGSQSILRSSVHEGCTGTGVGVGAARVGIGVGVAVAVGSLSPPGCPATEVAVAVGVIGGAVAVPMVAVAPGVPGVGVRVSSGWAVGDAVVPVGVNPGFGAGVAVVPTTVPASLGACPVIWGREGVGVGVA